MAYFRDLSLDEAIYRNDEECWDDYLAYLNDPFWKESIVVADDFTIWLEWNEIGKAHAERIESEEAAK